MRDYPAMPEAFRLRQMAWQLFATLTFQFDGLPERVRTSMLRAWLRKLCKSHHIYFPDLPYCWRFEFGASGGSHGHYHLIVAGLPQTATTPAGCRFAEALWARRGGGFARVAPYNPSLDGVGYVLKLPPPSAPGPTIEDDSQIPTLSEGVFRRQRNAPHS